MKTGDKVKHINTGDCVHTIKKLTENIATCDLDSSMIEPPINPRGKTVNVLICKIDNLIQITNGT